MSANKKKSIPRWVVLLVVLFAAVNWLSQNGSDFLSGNDSTSSAGSGAVAGSGGPAGKIGDYDVLQNCQLVNHRHNDGDSFLVAHGGEKTMFRLYFVDTAESEFKSYRDGNNNHKRIADQARYFSITDKQATQLGREAKKQVLELLAENPFTVLTRWENVYGPDRKYAFVQIQLDGKTHYLHEYLVKNGLVRIHTKGATMADGKSASDQKKYLYQLEKRAKSMALGAWGMN
ncbi:thermonuclease family protein [Persicirhabdus sediminis]|uniref:TNase-like domain-containing protein n=1 Tax=Persicirhabdus sediminis TaxID=454144 RepID=A0A8J7MCT1_9BACT|nr:hypothetical protein [Persicirhabdus sediminis]MBK1790130.1 hypothetical protein [Persicirhabdus sediminis]